MNIAISPPLQIYPYFESITSTTPGASKHIIGNPAAIASINTIPNNIGDLDYLHALILNGAQLNSIPESICDIDGLSEEFCQSAIGLQTNICNQPIIINLSNNYLCEEYDYECITHWEPQDQTNCP